MNYSSRDSLSKKARAAIRSFSWLWYMGLIMVVIYLVAGVCVDRFYFKPNFKSGFLALREPVYRAAQVSFILFAVLVFFTLGYLRRLYWGTLEQYHQSLARMMTRFRAGFLIQVALCDTVALLGLLLFLFNGDLKMILLFGVLAFVYYTRCYPSESIILPLIQRYFSEEQEEREAS